MLLPVAVIWDIDSRKKLSWMQFVTTYISMSTEASEPLKLIEIGRTSRTACSSL